MDKETGLYYYGARYLDPKYSRWLSGDPALSDYIPKAPIDDESKKHNENLPGMGGVFNVVNLHLYHYAGNNPVKYTDPDGKKIVLLNRSYGAGGYGHNAVLIGDDKNGWILYSKDDVDKNTRKEYKSLGEFIFENKEAPYDEKYDRAIVMETTIDEDKQMQTRGDSIYGRKYSLEEKENKTGEVSQNCADLVADVISPIGRILIGKPKIEKGSATRKGPYIWEGILFKEGKVFKSPINTNITWPNQQFDDVSNGNPGIGSCPLP